MDALITSEGEIKIQATNKVTQYKDSKTEISDILKASDVVMVGSVEPPSGGLCISLTRFMTHHKPKLGRV